MKRIFFIIGILVCIFLILFWIYFPSLSHYRELKQEEDRLILKLRDVDTKIQALIEERNLLKNDISCLEKVIRNELGVVKPGEIVYRLISRDDSSKMDIKVSSPMDVSSQTKE